MSISAPVLADEGTILVFLGPLTHSGGEPVGARFTAADGRYLCVAGPANDPHVSVDDEPHWESQHRDCDCPVGPVVRAAACLYRNLLATRRLG